MPKKKSKGIPLKSYLASGSKHAFAMKRNMRERLTHKNESRTHNLKMGRNADGSAKSPKKSPKKSPSAGPTSSRDLGTAPTGGFASQPRGIRTKGNG